MMLALGQFFEEMADQPVIQMCVSAISNRVEKKDIVNGGHRLVRMYPVVKKLVCNY
jgi:hypothetical protein